MKYRTKGTCSQMINFEVDENDVLSGVSFVGGCHGNLQGIGKLSPGFVMLATAYWKKAGKRLRMLPVYISKAEKTIQFGTIFVFNPDNPYADEQKRIIDETERQVFAMAGIEPDTEEAANA